MLHRYLLPLALLLTTALSATAQNWRPFRPNGDVHAYTLSRNGAATDTVLTLRLDSAGVRGADSVYFFNRMMRPVKSTGTGERWRKSRNNQFGARLRYETATKVYWLEWAAEVGEPARSIPLPVFLQSGTFMGGSATVVGRAVRQLAGQPDSVLTLRVGAETYEVSKSYGLITGPLPNGAGLTLARPPAVAGRSYYNPLLLLDLQPGDELGYYREELSFGGSLICESTSLLQRIISRQQTPDSLIYIVRYQSRTQTSGAPGCSAAGVTFQPPTTVRQAASLRTGQWRTSLGGAVEPSGYVQLLAYEWPAARASPVGIFMGHPIVPSRKSGGTCGPTATLRTQELFRIRGGMEDIYLPYFSFDWAGRNELLNAGLGVVQLQQGYGQKLQLTYYRRTSSAGTTTCGSHEPFGLLLSAAPGSVAAPGVRLYPNPAATTATLELPAPSTAPAHLTLLNATGQTLRTQQLPAGTTRAPVALDGLPAGLYLVRLEQPGKLPVVLRLQHEQ
ncbi:T9SS type A sorting domain-containing protein [Hymenobacter terrestris]|uniref:T9SS type A sorting domain-containing protein n=1 Tax=Hymenobacter terrestris TaxID=2748310 RepID=A0ABX2Q7K3_9BACT|nr:T9SS type A sorting domain-containing protein [Hymenobacter terrestris]NVO86250.1 T9SS type A sorting domain-containing protein [Hymenobacter terrestris]